MMLIHGLLIDLLEDKNGTLSYSVWDSEKNLGTIYKFYVGTDISNRGTKWRALKQDFDSLHDAVKVFLDFPECCPRGLGGDAT